MSHDNKSTRQRWNQLEFSGENATLKCTRIKAFVPSCTRTFHNKIPSRFITKYLKTCPNNDAMHFVKLYALSKYNLTKRIASLLGQVFIDL